MRPARMPSATSRGAPGPVTAPDEATILSWPIFSSRVIAASNLSMRPMASPPGMLRGMVSIRYFH